MSKFLQRMMIFGAVFLLPMMMNAQQLTNANFEDWSAAAFNGEPQPKGWNASNVEQVGLKFNFAHKETGHGGGYCMMVQDQDVGALGITETSPGYFALGQPWVYVKSVPEVSKATAGTSGGISWKYRPDSMSVWIKRTGSNTDKEDFYLLYYAWSGTAKGDKYKAKDGSCTSHSETNEESDVRQELNGNECGTLQKASQVAEGMWRQKKTYGSWTNIRVPIYYFNNNVPSMMNIIFSASNYPNYRANSGLYAGNSLYIDDVELIYSSRIQKLYIDNIEWRAFDPNSTEIQSYSLGESATSIPDIKARRGAGSLTNARGKTVSFPGRELSGSEISIVKGDLESTPTYITVKSEDGKSSTIYRIQFQRAPSSNATLAEIAVNGELLENFRPGQTNYNVELPYGTTAAPVVTYTLAEDAQTAVVTQATSPTGKATIVVTAADKTTKKTYTLNFSVGQLKDVTLQDIKVNGKSIPGFTPAQAVYKVSLPVGTASLNIQPVSAYPAGEQTITITPNPLPSGEAINGATVQVSVSAPGAPTPKVYKLNIKLEQSSYSYLANLEVLGEQISDVNPSKLDQPTVLAFDPEQTTYYVNLKMGTKELPQILWTPGDEYQTITKEEGGIDGTTRINVLAGNKSDQTVYKLVFSTAKSEYSLLDGIEIGGVPLEGFLPTTYNYSYVLPVNTTTLPEIKPIAHDEFQEIVVTTGGVNGKTRISVTAGNGNTTNYYITFSVATYTDNTLKSLSVAGYSLQDADFNPIAFDPQRNDYWVRLDNEQVPDVLYELQNEEFQSVTPFPTTLPNGKYKLTVRPKNGASRTYTIQFVYKLSENAALQMIYINDTIALPEFEPDKTDYIFTLDTGTVEKPNVTWVAGEASQEITAAWDWEKQRTVRITVKAENRMVKRTYKIKFYIPSAASTQLANIRLVEDGDTTDLPGGFSKDKYEYSYPLHTATCPTIIAVPAVEKQQITITSPYAAGTATILVRMDDSQSQYSIEFVKAPVTSAQLTDILVNGESLKDKGVFVPTTLDYDGFTYSGELPSVIGIAEGGDSVPALWKDNTARLFVEDAEHNKAVYSLSFTRLYSSDNTLEGIYADGVLIDGFDKSVLNYAYNLPAGSTYPAITYQVSEAAQVVFSGQLEEGKWGIHVVSENGDEAVYTVAYTILPYTDATLANLEVEDYDIAYQPSTNEYTGLVIAQGTPLPQVTATPREGQSVMIYTTNDSTQTIQVLAQDGTPNTYIIRYTHVKNDNVKLADILIEGFSLAEFDPDVHAYTIPLPRGTKTVPNIHPVGAVDNQTITTYFCRPNGVTKIHIVAQNGNTGDYTIAFPLEKSNETALASLRINGEEKNVDETEYQLAVPFGTTEPYDVIYEKADDGQLVRFIDAPLTGVTKIIVTNETGTSTRTYSIRYTIAEPKGENKIAKVKYTYNDAAGDAVLGEMELTEGENKVALPFGAQSFDVTEVVKNYEEQTVLFYNGGIRRGAKIIAVANRADEEDVTYTIIPEMPEFDEKGKLSNLTFKGEKVPNFRPDIYNYMVNVTAQPTADQFVGTAFGGKTVTKSALDNKKKQITLTVEGGETYSVCWYYTKYDNIFNFSVDWTKAAQGNGYKPSSLWKVPADYTWGYEWGILSFNFIYSTGKEVTPGGTNGVILSTLRGAPMNTSVPGMMTLGSMSLTLGSSGNSSSSVTKNASTGTEFKNTPESLSLQAKPLSTNNITNWNLWLTISDGSKYNESTFSGNFNSVNTWQTVNMPISYSGLGTVSKFNILLSSCDQENANKFNGSTIYESSVMLNDIHFVYNSQLTKAIIEDKELTPNANNEFIYELQANEDMTYLPAMKFVGAVHDQMQTIEWLNDGEWVNGERKAKVTNYGENSEDNTVYTVILKRTPVTTTEHTASFGSYPTTVKGDTVFVNLPYGTQRKPDMNILPESVYQRVKMTKRGDAVSVIVTAENGASDTTVYVLREQKSNDALLEVLALEGSATLNVVDAANLIYSVVADQMPAVEYQKKRTADDRTMGQAVDMTESRDSVTLVVTAAAGNSRTYTIRRIDPTVVSNGQIDEFEKGGQPWSELGGETYDATGNKPTDVITFERKFAKDSVVYIQTPDRMEWQVYGDVNHTYVLHYPTAQSSNTNLGGFALNGVPYEEFMPGDLSYELFADSAIQLSFIPAEPEQSLDVSSAVVTGGVEYTVVVTAENGTDQKTYTVKVTQPLDGNALLAGILLDDVMLPDFDPLVSDYTVTLSVGAYKVAQPKIPDVTYLVGHKGQTVVLAAGALNDEATEIAVTSEDGKASMNYYLTIQAEKSHCADLTGIIVNGEAIEHFEPGRHFYSVSVNSSEITIDYTADDRFLTVTSTSVEISAGNEYQYTLHVTAEDGTTSDYFIEVYVENRSNDAQLANILLNSKSMDKFEPSYNHDLFFDGGNNNYEIKMPSDGELPEISAQLKMDGQTVDLEYRRDDKLEIDSVLLYVTAVDGVTHNVYTLRFVRELSTDSHLQFIEINNILLPDFEPTKYFYQYPALQTGEAKPRVTDYGMPHESATVDVDDDDSPITITVHAQDDSYVSTYTIAYEYKQSKVATLNLIRADGDTLPGFHPDTFYYSLSLPVGRTDFPTLDAEEGEEHQRIVLKTVDYDAAAQKLVRQFIVYAEDTTFTQSYYITYHIEKSTNDALQMIYIGGKQLPDFQPDVLDYRYQLTASEATALNGELPEILCELGDEWQDTTILQVRDITMEKTLGNKHMVTVTAAAGNSRTYTIQYPVELSSDATLNMIMLAGKPLPKFDSERPNYNIELARTADIPVVTVVKKEDAQTYEIYVDNEKDIVTIDVWAEDYTQNTYTLTFERVLADITTIDNIILSKDGKQLSYELFDFAPDTYDYTIVMPFDSTITEVKETDLPDITIKCDSTVKDTIITITQLNQTDIQVTITLIAENGYEGNPYTLLFRFTLNNDASLVDLKVNGVTIMGFKSDKLDYTYKHPYGSDSTDFFLPKQVEFVKADPLATDYVYQDEEGVINITITAHDGKSQNTYSIRQVIGLDTVCTLDKIVWEGGELPGFDPEVTFYTYLLSNTASSIPTGLQGITTSPRSRVSIMEGGPNDTTLIICIAQDSLNYKKEYRVLFKKTEVNDGIPASSEQEVFIRRVKGASQLFVSTIRSGVAFALYDQTGRMVYFCENLPYADPNDVDVAQDGWNKDVILNVDVDLRSGIIVDINPRQIYFYSFTSVNSKIIKSGKLIALP